MLVDSWTFNIEEVGKKKITAANWNQRQFNSHAKIYLPHSGEAAIGIGGNWLNCVQGFLYFIPPWTPLELKCKTYFNHSWIHFVPSKSSERALLALIGQRMQIMPQDVKWIKSIFNRLVKNRNDNEGYQLANQGYLRILLSEFIQHYADNGLTILSGFAKFANTLEYIDMNITGNLSSKNLADIGSWHPTYFANCFSKCFGIGPKEYVIMRRIAKARQLLCDTSISIKEIGVQIGIPDSFYFSKLFKQRTGISPRQFRITAIGLKKI